MTITESQYPALARQYLFATAGTLLPGLVHNLNNYLQVLDMQLELINRKDQGNMGPAGSNLSNSLDRLAKSVSGLSDQLQSTDTRTFYCSEEQTQINLDAYLQWLDSFWGNNLFFKHHIDFQIKVQPDIPSLEVPPFYLTLCLEEPLKNAVEALRETEPETSVAIRLEATAQGEGVLFKLISPGRIKEGIDPWQEGATTKATHMGYGLNLVAHFSEKLGWSSSLNQSDSETTYSLTVPSVRTLAPE